MVAAAAAQKGSKDPRINNRATLIKRTSSLSMAKDERAAPKMMSSSLKALNLMSDLIRGALLSICAVLLGQRKIRVVAAAGFTWIH